MSILKIAQMGHPVLREMCKPVPIEQIGSHDVQSFIQDMFETMIDADGAGLAAPQVHKPIRIAICTFDEGVIVLINPILTPKGDTKIATFEGCLSVDGIRGEVERWENIHLEAFSQTGEKIDVELHGWNAIVAQHECDHLDGSLFIDKCDTKTLAFLPEYSRYMQFEEQIEGEE
jgi:peptide deformylase